MTGQGSHDFEAIQKARKANDLAFINVAKVDKTFGGHRVRGLVYVNETQPNSAIPSRIIKGQVLIEDLESKSREWHECKWEQGGKMIVTPFFHYYREDLRLTEREYVTPRLPKLF